MSAVTNLGPMSSCLRANLPSLSVYSYYPLHFLTGLAVTTSSHMYVSVVALFTFNVSLGHLLYIASKLHGITEF
jgi:hypothetical protein